MDTASPINTRNSQESQSPQDTGTPGASDAADFQSTAPAATLNEGAKNLTVQETGEPADAIAKVTEGWPVAWVIGIVLLVAAGGFIFYKLLKESIDETAEPAPAPKPAASKKPAAAAKKSAAQRSAKKKSAPNQRKKNSRTRK